MTGGGGTGGYGTVYVNYAGSGCTILHNSSAFGAGSFPCGSVTLFGTNLYGMTGTGGITGPGTLTGSAWYSRPTATEADSPSSTTSSAELATGRRRMAR